MRAWLGALLCIAFSTAAIAATPRDILITVAFATSDKASALKQVIDARQAAQAILQHAPRDREARFQHALATGYHARLTRSRSEALEARRMIEALIAANPRDPETQAALAGWHLDAIDQLGGFAARTVLGAKKADGLAALDRAVELGGERAAFPAIAALMRIRLDPGDTPKARMLAEAASRASASTRFDRILQARATALLTPLRAGNGKAAAALAKRSLPFGQLSPD